jgi:hypothetical protein
MLELFFGVVFSSATTMIYQIRVVTTAVIPWIFEDKARLGFGLGPNWINEKTTLPPVILSRERKRPIKSQLSIIS